MALLRQLAPHITLIDLQFQGRVETIAAYLIYNGETAALIETGPASTIDTLLEGIQAAGAPLEALRQIFVTHIHLDHASGASVLARQLPWTRIYVHPAGAPHLADPSKLLASAARLYGDQMETLWGTILPVPAERLVSVHDGEEIPIPGSTLRVLETPGHARHHHAYLDVNSGLLFTGDIGGVRMPGIQYVRPPPRHPNSISKRGAPVSRACAHSIPAACVSPTLVCFAATSRGTGTIWNNAWSPGAILYARDWNKAPMKRPSRSNSKRKPRPSSPVWESTPAATMSPSITNHSSRDTRATGKRCFNRDEAFYTRREHKLS
jgi:glyoxylase-like metal-dependent hydrolase (beta-lactamase superfamily II)